jgi:two-component system, OmpR family, manganese sensing sensor histidine kinase
MFQATRLRLALWYTTVTAVLLLLFASGVYWYVRNTLVERVDDTLNHVVEIVERSLVIEPDAHDPALPVRVLTARGMISPPMQVNVAASFRNNSQALEDDHIDLEWFGPDSVELWSTFSEPLSLPLHVNLAGETVRIGPNDLLLRQITHRIQQGNQLLGYLRVSHPWFEVTKPSRQLMLDLIFWSVMIVAATGMIGWLLSGLAMAPVLESYQQLKQFTADASHELRNPIAVIQTNVQVALSDPEPDVVFQHSQLQVIERLTRRLGRLVDNLLFLARQESGLVPLQRTAVELSVLLAEVVEEQQVLALEKGIDLKAPDLASGLNGASGDQAYWVCCDRDQLTRLFTNLISNALQYTPSQGEVRVGLEPLKYQNQGAYQITIQDTGIGIAPEVQDRVFDRFYRVDPARSRASMSEGGIGDGSGLGLAIAKVITQNHQGQIALSSTPEQGTTVTVTLPQSKAVTHSKN